MSLSNLVYIQDNLSASMKNYMLTHDVKQSTLDKLYEHMSHRSLQNHISGYTYPGLRCLQAYIDVFGFDFLGEEFMPDDIKRYTNGQSQIVLVKRLASNLECFIRTNRSVSSEAKGYYWLVKRSNSRLNYAAIKKVLNCESDCKLKTLYGFAELMRLERIGQLFNGEDYQQPFMKVVV